MFISNTVPQNRSFVRYHPAYYIIQLFPLRQLFARLPYVVSLKPAGKFLRGHPMRHFFAVYFLEIVNYSSHNVCNVLSTLYTFLSPTSSLIAEVRGNFFIHLQKKSSSDVTILLISSCEYKLLLVGLLKKWKDNFLDFCKYFLRQLSCFSHFFNV